MAIRVSSEARRTAIESIDAEHAAFGTAATLPDLSLADAPLANSGTAMFEAAWISSVSQYTDLLDAAATALGVVADAIILADRQAADELTAQSNPRGGPQPR